MSLLIGKHIEQTLSANQEIVSKIGNRIYPHIICEGTPSYPFVVFVPRGIHTEYTKDGRNEDNTLVQVSVVSKDYDEMIDIANLIRYAFDGVSARYEKFRVNGCKVDSSLEEYIDDIEAYGINIILNFKTNDNG